jgi:hypothetical protein
LGQAQRKWILQAERNLDVQQVVGFETRGNDKASRSSASVAQEKGT